MASRIFLFLILFAAYGMGEKAKVDNHGLVIGIVIFLVVLCVILALISWKVKFVSKAVDHIVKIVDLVSFIGTVIFFSYEFGIKNIVTPEPLITEVSPVSIDVTVTFTPTNVTPIKIPTPTATPARETITSTPTLTKLEIAEDAARRYYTALKNKDIDTAWGMLTAYAVSNVVKSNYETYSDFWKNKIKDVEIISIDGVNTPGRYYIARAKTRYLTKDDEFTQIYIIDLYFIRGDKDDKLYLDTAVDANK